MVKDDLKIIFFGNTDFSKMFLKYLVETVNYNVVAVVTDPDKQLRKHGKSFIKTTEVKQYAVENNIPVIHELDADVIREYNANLFIVVAFKFLKKEIWSMPEYGTINIHPSLLPEFRGPAPIEHAIIQGKEDTGVTCFYINDDIDSGDIIEQISVHIPFEKDAAFAYKTMAYKGAECLRNALEKIIAGNGKAQTTKQDISKVSKAPKIYNTKIDWNNDVEDVYNLIRALKLHNGAYTFINGIEVRILSAEPTRMAVLTKDIEVFNNNVFIGCKTFGLLIKTVKPAGKKEMDAHAFINGLRNKFDKFEITD